MNLHTSLTTEIMSISSCLFRAGVELQNPYARNNLAFLLRILWATSGNFILNDGPHKFWMLKF